MSDANASGTVQPGQMPYAAADRDPTTAWTSNFDTSESAWWRLDLEEPRKPSTGCGSGRATSPSA